MPTEQEQGSAGDPPGFVARHRAAIASASVWSVAYAVLWASGQRFSTEYLTYGWQLVPFETLRDDPFGSVWYLHTQPPLWNLVIGVVARWSWFPTAISLQLVFAVLGIALAGTLAELARRLGATNALAIGASLVAMLNTEVAAMFFTPQYEMPVALALALIATVLATPPVRWSARHLVAVVVLGTAVVMTRALFHPLWLVALVVLVLLARRIPLRSGVVLASLVVPVVVVGGWMYKNDVLYDRFTLSTWTGMNLQRAVLPVLPQEELDRLVADGDLSMVSEVGAFANWADYAPYVDACPPTKSHPAVSEPTWRTPIEAFGFQIVVANFNYECYLVAYDQAGHDAWWVTRHRPGVWWEGRMWAARSWFTMNPTIAVSPSAPMRALGTLGRVARLEVPVRMDTSGWNAPLFGPVDAQDIPAQNLSLTMVLATFVVVANGAVHIVGIGRRRRAASVPVVTGGALASIFVTFVVGWTYLVGVAGELGEQARFRTMTDPLVVVVAIVVVG
ncbi:MAG TPA: hypothetical protein VL916_14720, partial [Ilumatobacteraceae bacterium]|nr:hypothetical protein [Ilumatobacteraceae bacterium]